MKTKRPRDDYVEPELAGSRRRATPEETVIPVLQEELDVHTERVETHSGVRVEKHVQRHEEIVDEPLAREEVEVERVAINQPVDQPVAVRYEGDTMIVPVLEEVLVVEKRLMLKEEIRITRRKAEYRAPQRVTLRRERADVQRIENSQENFSGASCASPAGEPDGAESLLEEKRRQNEDLRRTLESPRTRK